MSKIHRADSTGTISCNYSGQARGTHRWLRSQDWREVTCSRCVSKATRARLEAREASTKEEEPEITINVRPLRGPGSRSWGAQ